MVRYRAGLPTELKSTDFLPGKDHGCSQFSMGSFNAGHRLSSFGRITDTPRDRRRTDTAIGYGPCKRRVNRRMLIHVRPPGILRRLWRGEQGQDLVEYTLMVAFLAMTSAAIFFSAGGSVNVVWVSASSTLQGAANPGSGGPPDTPPDTGDHDGH